ncbi:MAG: MopE-related protein, partial [Bacteroidota bacterium]
TISVCDSYTWAINGTSYTESGEYSVANGCHTEILKLTITPSTSNTTTISVCNSYTWAVNGNTYTASGEYSVVNGCHTEILKLTITPALIWYLDADADGYYSGTPLTQCTSPGIGYRSTGILGGGDCNDAIGTINPTAIEICDGLDNNCNGTIDEGFPIVTYYRDADGDGFGNAAITTTAKCGAPAGYVTNSTDCNDSDAAVNTPKTYYTDADKDGYGSALGKTIVICSSIAPTGYSANNTDCNDKAETIHPNAIEICDGFDNNCNGIIDESCSFVTISVNDPSIQEGNNGKKNLDFVVSLSQASLATIKVNFTTTDGTANSSSDYGSKLGTLSFKPGTTTLIISIQISGDKLYEANEIFNVILSNPQSAIINKSTGIGTILNDDAAPTRLSATNEEDYVSKSVQIAPNPAMHFVNLKLNHFAEGEAQFEIINSIGKVLLSEYRILQKGENNVQLDIQKLNSGIHYIQIRDADKKTIVVKMMKY